LIGVRLGILTGLRAEARIADRLGARIEIGGGTRAGADRAASRLIEAGVDALLSFGLAGGLDPALASGAMIVPWAVMLQDGRPIACAPELVHWLGGATVMHIADHAGVIATRAEKAAVFAASGAAAVDLESGPLALAAEAAGLPFAVLRAVCDPAGRDLPPAALAALNAGGGVRLLHVAGALLRRPAQLPDLLQLAADAAKANAALQHFVTAKEAE
jgi:adenosylhomocysteine nucleosidase